MPRKGNATLPQPVFDEPAFSEGVVTADPSTFKTAHASDTQQYKQIQDLLKKDVVGFDPSRAKPGDLFALQDALGPHGPEIVQGIQKAGQIVFHSVGDTGAASVRKYANELHVADQVTA